MRVIVFQVCVLHSKLLEIQTHSRITTTTHVQTWDRVLRANPNELDYPLPILPNAIPEDADDVVDLVNGLYDDEPDTCAPLIAFLQKHLSAQRTDTFPGVQVWRTHTTGKRSILGGLHHRRRRNVASGSLLDFSDLGSEGRNRYHQQRLLRTALHLHQAPQQASAEQTSLCRCSPKPGRLHRGRHDSRGEPSSLSPIPSVEAGTYRHLHPRSSAQEQRPPPIRARVLDRPRRDQNPSR